MISTVYLAMHSKPLVSVVIATRNRPDLLDRAVQSVLSQSYSNVEIVVVDENDPDSEGRQTTEQKIAAIRETLRENGALTYLDDREPTWVCTARNEGVAASQGELVAFLDDDDWWYEEKLSKQVERFVENPLDPALVYTGLRVVDGEGRVLKDRIPRHRGRIMKQLLRENVIGTPSSVLIRRHVFDELGGFDPIFPTRHDLDLYLRVAERYAIDFVPESLTVYTNLQKDAMSKNFANKMKGRELIFEKFLEHYRHDSQLRAAHHYGTALLCLKHGRKAQAQAFFRKSIASKYTVKAALRLLLNIPATVKDRKKQSVSANRNSTNRNTTERKRH